MAKSIAFIDTEVGIEDKRIQDIGAVRTDGATFHSPSLRDFHAFISDVEYVCGHNIIHHDLEFLQNALGEELDIPAIDTLYLSPLLFPTRPNHSLSKEEKLLEEELNNPVNDSRKAEKLFYDEVNAFQALPSFLKQVFFILLSPQEEFYGFFDYIDFRLRFLHPSVQALIRTNFQGKICSNADLVALSKDHPIELAYALALIWADDSYPITPPWLSIAFPQIVTVFQLLRNRPCGRCEYCRKTLDIHHALQRIFNYDSFRLYAGEPLQERAVQAAVDGKSLLAVFPTGGGKSLTFQLPAMMAAETVNGLTVVISPLQSLMKDQVDNLIAQGITSAVTVNGLLDPIEKASSLQRISNGTAHLLYISPEQLRSRTIERLLSSRNVVRFVIDEAHCFSAWGQDFRVDYLYIGDFIRQLQSKKAGDVRIPVSCFTATAKQKVISDIRDYFKRTLNLDLDLFASTATRENLRYSVIHCETEEIKYNNLRNLILQKDCPTIVYCSRTKRTRELATRLTKDGFPARPFNGKMDPNDKIINQEAFIRNEIKIIVATSAFGMGVDKKDVRLVVHYDISSSLEDYVQEAGRAGRNPEIQADCYVLYNDNDLDKHFILLNQTKLSLSEIQQVWKAIKDLSKQRSRICCSTLEIARQAGWNEQDDGTIGTRVKTAIQALETAGYVKRGNNMPSVFATGIAAKNTEEAIRIINQSDLFTTEEERTTAIRIIKSLKGESRRAEAGYNAPESRIDYLADILALSKKEVMDSVTKMQQAGILNYSRDMTAFIQATDTVNKSMQVLDRFSKLERFIFSKLDEDGCVFNLKELNEAAQDEGIRSTVKDIRTLFYYLTIKDYILKEENIRAGTVKVYPTDSLNRLRMKLDLRMDICKFLLEHLFMLANGVIANAQNEKLVEYSLVGLYDEYKVVPKLEDISSKVSIPDVEDALLYLSKIGSMKLEGGFLVLYNALEIHRLVKDNRIKYKVEDYRLLNDFYKQKIQMIHIVGEFANLMVRDYDAALQYVDDYFLMDYKKFIEKYFKGRIDELDKNITPGKYSELFDALSEAQKDIISDKDSQYIVVAAGPGSGKTRVLVHKLASLIMLEDVKSDQLLMLTFSRAAATEFKKRLMELVGNAANFVDIKTFHSYCFDLLGKIGNLEEADDVVENATKMILNGEVEPGKITKSVLVIDEAQDMSEKDFALVQALMQINEDMRVIAVGDDDQNIFAFRGSDSKYLRTLTDKYGATKYEMPENYRSQKSIVALSNAFVLSLKDRMKSVPCIAMQEERGRVIITNHCCKNFIEALVSDVIRTHRREKACILTQTNNEAMQVLGLLEKKGVRAKLIQSLGKQFRLSNLAEIRYFLSIIDSHGELTVIPRNVWKDAKDKLFSAYANSACLEICENFIQDFETVCPNRYRTDLEEFIRESQYEDFYRDDQALLYVSTIHKAKGREFDNVYMLLQNCYIDDDEKRRTLYVGMTRAKSALYIHCNTNIFNNYSFPGVRHVKDPTVYSEPSELLVQLTHRDVYLDFFKSRQDIIKKLRSGMRLALLDEGLCVLRNNELIQIVSFSKAFKEKLVRWASQGYRPVAANVQFVVAWKGENDEQESYIVLPIIKLRRE